MSDKFTTQEIPKFTETKIESRIANSTVDDMKSHFSEINSIKHSEGDEKAEKIAALIGEKAASSSLARHLFPELAPHSRSVGMVEQGHVDLTNPNDPDYVLPESVNRLSRQSRYDVTSGKISSKDVVNILQLAKELDMGNSTQLIDGAIAGMSMPCGQRMDKNGKLTDFAIGISHKTDVQEVQAVRDSFDKLRRNSDSPEEAVKTILGDAFPPKQGTTPYANLQANIKIIDEFLLPALRHALEQ